MLVMPVKADVQLLVLVEKFDSEEAGQLGKVFFSSHIQMPSLDGTDNVYLSSSATELNPILIDDVLEMWAGGEMVLSHDFAASGKLVPKLIQLSADQINKLSGNVVNVVYKDRYGKLVYATPVYIVIK
jgi:hypothetical protein